MGIQAESRMEARQTDIGFNLNPQNHGFSTAAAKGTESYGESAHPVFYPLLPLTLEGLAGL